MGGDAPRIGLVLGAGGVAGGAFHAGVLAALEEATGWDPRTAEVVMGTSAGSITGATLRAGLPARDLLARATDRPLSAEGRAVVDRLGPVIRPPSLQASRERRQPSDVVATLARAARRPLAARPWSLLAALLPDGAVSTDMISDSVAGIFPGAWPSAPLLICAVRKADGRRVVFGRGGHTPPLAQAVAASCAIPGFFRPVEVEGAAHIDGGVHSPTNADVLLDAGPFDLVIVSSPMSRRGRRPRVAPDQAMRTWAGALLDAEARRLRRRGIPLIAFQPDDEVLAAMGPNAMDPSRRGDTADQSRTSTRARLTEPRVVERLAALLH